MFFEVYIDSIGRPCVVSVKDEVHIWDVKNVIKSSLNDMPKWQPAILAGHPIGSTVILKVHFTGNVFWVGFAKKEEIGE